MDTKASKQRKILTSALPPKDKEFLWLHQTGGQSILKDFVNGKWVAVGDLVTSSHTEDLEPYTPTTPSGNEGYVTRDTLNRALSIYVTNSSLSSTLSTFQKKLTPGLGIKISGNTISVDVDTALSSNSTKPLANSTINSVFNQLSANINNLNTTKQNKLGAANAGDNITITSVNGIVKISAANTGSGSDYSALDSRITALETAGYVPRTWFKTINEVSIINDNYPNGDKNITISGGSGTGSSVDIVQDGEPTDDTNTLYFFTRNPLQGVGLYNTLLQNGSLRGSDGKTYTYHPSKFYHLYPDGSFDELVEIPGQRYADCNPGSNDVYYNYNTKDGQRRRVLTTMKWYGEIIVPHLIQYADTSDTAYYSLQVTGPFYAQQTNIEFEYNSSDLQVILVDKNELYEPVYTDLSTLDNKVIFTNDNHYIARSLLFKRKYNDINELKTPKDISLVLNNGITRTNVTIKYGATQIFYKEGDTQPMDDVPGFDSTVATNVRIEPRHLVYRLNSQRGIVIKDKVKIDQSKYNIIYAKVINYPGSVDAGLGSIKIDDNSRLKIYAYRSDENLNTAISLPKSYIATTEGYGENKCYYEYSLYGESALTCTLREVRPYYRQLSDSVDFDPDNPDILTLSEIGFYQKIATGEYHISEIGVITHEDPEVAYNYNQTDEDTPVSDPTKDAPSILLFGNSFTIDSWSYVPYLLKEFGINIKIGVFHSAGMGFASVNQNFETNLGSSFGNRGFSYINTASTDVDKNNKPVNQWHTVYTSPMAKECVQYYEGMENDAVPDPNKIGKLWDIVVFQQSSTGSYYLNNYGASTIQSLENKVTSNMNKSIQFAWNLNHATGGINDLPEDIITCIKTVFETVDNNISFVFPYGTAIFNGRNNHILKNVVYHNSILNEDFTDLYYDGQHLVGGMPYYLASITIIEQLFRKFYQGTGLSITNNIFTSVLPDRDWLAGRALLPGRGTVFSGVTEQNCAIAREAAIRACNNPWQIYCDNSTVHNPWPVIVVIKTNAYSEITDTGNYDIPTGTTDAAGITTRYFFVEKGHRLTGITISATEGHTISQHIWWQHLYSAYHYAPVINSIDVTNNVECHIDMEVNQNIFISITGK